MNVEVVYDKRSEVKQYLKEHKKQIIAGVGLAIGGAIMWNVFKKPVKIDCGVSKYGTKFVSEALRIGRDSDGAFTTQARGVTVKDLGELGEEMLRFTKEEGSGLITENAEVVGALVYYKLEK